MSSTSAARPRATIIDIAKAAGVSKSTVSLVLKRSGLVKPDTRDRVTEAMRALGYVYNRGAANLRMARSNVVGMVISDLMNPFFAELAVGLEDAFYKAGYVPVLANTDEDAGRQARVLQTLREQGVAGMVISPALGTDPATLREFAQGGVPAVTTMRRVAESGLPYVGPDNHAGAHASVAYLLDLGHRRVAFFGGFGSMATQRERVSGYAAGLAAAGIPFDPALVFETRPTRAGGAEAVDRAFALPCPPTAATCYNDIVAIGAIAALARRGKRAGPDFSVIGFDDIVEAEHNAPPLTTVTAHTRRMGAAAADLLLAIISGAAPAETNVIGEVRLVVRESCAALARTSEDAHAALRSNASMPRVARAGAAAARDS
jgi:LacI family transcriptional regulator